MSRTTSSSSRFTTPMSLSTRSTCAFTSVSISRLTPCAAPAALDMSLAISSKKREEVVGMGVILSGHS
jgi:hypothetical protein